MAKINFAPIDAKEYPVVSIGYQYHGRTVEEEKLRLDIEWEYLESLSKLQDRLKEKYQTLLDELDVTKPDPMEAIWEAQDTWHNDHPSDSHHDRLFYT